MQGPARVGAAPLDRPARLATAGARRIAADAARLLVELVGPEPGLLSGEVDKLACYAGDRKAISRDDVALMVGAGRVLEVWDMIDRATPATPAAPWAILDRLMTSGEAPQRLLAALATSLRKVYHAGALRRMRLDLPDACRKAGIPPMAVDKVGRQHAHLGPAASTASPASCSRPTSP